MKYIELIAKLENIKIDLDEDHILLITMNRPKALNALNSQTLDELQAITQMISEDNDVYGVVITGEGRGFVAGADIVQMKPYKSEAGRTYGGTQRLARLIGPGLAKEMIYTGRQVRADEARMFGLVNQVVPAEELVDAAKEMMRNILRMSPVGIKYAKIAINRGADMDLRNGLELEKDLVGLCFATEDKEIGMAAFLEKAKPSFAR